jgi:carbonic anhydrase/acetyltransferase-like protein (isoleucine patch superfamily)
MIEKYKEHKPEIHESCYIHKASVIMGKVKLGQNVSVWPLACLRGDVNRIEIGDNSNIQECVSAHVNYNDPLILGKNVTVGHGAVIHGCVVGDNSLIGMNAVVMESKIGENCVIGAGSVVPPGKEIPPRSMVMGIPGKVVRELSDKEIDMLKHSAEEYMRLAKEYRESN